MRLIISLILAALMVSCATPPARSQSSALVVAVCGTLPLAYLPGAVRPLTQDTTGKMCDTATGGGGGAVTMALGAVASGAYSSGSIASGAFASGALASGSVASGAFASGALASGSVASGALASGSIAAGAMVDFLTTRGTKAAGTAAANSLLTGGVYNSGGVTLTDGQQAAVQFDSAGNLKVVGTGVAQGSTTSGQTLSPVGGFTTTAAPSYTTAQTNGLSLTTAGGLRSDQASWAGTALGTPTNFGTTPTAVVAASANASLFIGTVAASSGNGVVGTGVQRVAIASDNTPFPTKIDQTTSSVTNGVMNAGSAYETIAASQTAQAMGATGATGDYLSHCVIYPTTTTPGVVTVFDNTSAAGSNVIAFPGGASSVSNLAPIAIPVGAISTAGAWKVTTGANVVVTCYGKFT